MAERLRGAPPDCHPDRKHFAHGECERCYKNRLRRDSIGYHANRAKYRGTAAYKAYGAKYALARRERIDALKTGPCVDCGGTFPPECMDFDHINSDKVASVSDMGTRSLASVMVEIAKCELVCANCHRIRTRARWDARPVGERAVRRGR